MNEQQKKILKIVAYVITGMLLLPPYHELSKGHEIQSLGYGFVFSPPESGSIDRIMLLIQLLAVSAIGGIVAFVTKDDTKLVILPSMKKWALAAVALLGIVLYSQYLSRQPRELPDAELVKLQGTAAITNYGWVEIEFYNGSSWKVNDLYIQVGIPKPKDLLASPNPLGFIPDGERIRVYKIPSYTGVDPQTAKTFKAEGFDQYVGKDFTWHIVKAVGTP